MKLANKKSQRLCRRRSGRNAATNSKQRTMSERTLPKRSPMIFFFVTIGERKNDKMDKPENKHGQMQLDLEPFLDAEY
jgi:hypothetical protein